ncbi:hypothetical protein BDZ85DRAFT_38772 [Elsinoe ampelina]|uniref:Thiaminase-2/PQQC domain-containing protein n=1 Tax=Elsinoe ampelina TaxID=302913 RepID=A0A6A6G208_9PEZI|nr:hypothetical protein BDZ85DRAFT_38772 [Elsinoe ampelina]
MPPKFTDRLMSLDPQGFKAATQHPWLRLIGQGKLPQDAQLQWLQQDRIYALSYVAFVASLLAKVSIPTTSERLTTLEWRIADMLIEALDNIRRELGMFESILKKHFDWGMTQETPKASTTTRIYQQLFAAATTSNAPLVIGLAALWGTERCYLESWRFAKQQTSASTSPKTGYDVVGQVLIPNWTSTEFESFVNDIGSLLDELVASSSTTEEDIGRCEEMWRQVLWCEERFWPEVKLPEEGAASEQRTNQ